MSSWTMPWRKPEAKRPDPPPYAPRAARAVSEEDAAVDAAVVKLKEARRLDSARQYGAAVGLYEEGLTLLMERLRTEPNPQKKAVLNEKASEYMTLAEAAKAKG
eukprot:CAMPEP_0119289204 /NCGR_PEP_ID=MMETSP1329-20130426/38645_1 /TAXON_ID=114041 /ORGANISM="Genus nov. species nov., Strain RCC1024" /LENGTH=103 /DNA_ID=CAMNT_0007289999 /DNA_START=108 /DNA_END=416 /DNA_ORIENTATION=+